MLYSRATIEPWVRMLPISVTRPLAWENSCVQAGVVIGHTRMVPGCIFAKSAGDMTRLARAVVWPGLQALPFRMSLSASLAVLP